MSDPVVISSGDLTATISPLGAELLSLLDASGREYMTDADPAFWTGHAPLLFPIVGGLAGNSYRLDGRTYSLPRHGFARRSPFARVAQAADHVLFRLVDSAETRAAYPFSFTLDMAFAVSKLGLSMEASVTNSGDIPLPFSFGYHPAFAWPLPGGGDKLAHRLRFECAEPHDIWRLDDDGLLAHTERTPVDIAQLALDPALFESDALIWRNLSSRALSYRSPRGVELQIAFPDMDTLGLWQTPGANFLCIEPWAGFADPVDFDGDIRDKPGIVLLEAGEQQSFRLAVTVRPMEEA